MSISETLLENLAQELRTQVVYVGDNWVLSLISADDGTQYAGVAAAAKQFTKNSRFPIGHYPLNEDAATIAQLLRSQDNSEASVGLATLNALLQVEKIAVSDSDAADWLTQACTNRSIAIFGRFPFIDEEVRPFASQVWVFEQTPKKGEYSAKDMPEILPQADVIAITASTIINHTIDDILLHTASDSIAALLGPSTPLSTKLFEHGIDALFGVQVANIQNAVDSVQAGAGFRKMQGLRRVSLFKAAMP
jgi:uncharacterized protein